MTYGSNVGDTASNAIVFMINGMNVQVQVLVAYYFLTNLDAEKRKDLLLFIIAEILKKDVCIANVTFDGLPANTKMCELLSACLDPFDMKPYFVEPSKKHKIYIVLDLSHCVKLVRNNFATRNILYDADNNKIKWTLLEKLVAFGKNCD